MTPADIVKIRALDPSITNLNIRAIPGYIWVFIERDGVWTRNSYRVLEDGSIELMISPKKRSASLYPYVLNLYRAGWKLTDICIHTGLSSGAIKKIVGR